MIQRSPLNALEVGEGLTLENTGDAFASQKMALGSHLTPFSVYDLTVTDQDAETDGASLTGITWEKDENNRITLQRAQVTSDEPEEPEAVKIKELDMSDPDLLGKVETSSEVSPPCDLTKVEGGIQISGTTGTGENYVHVAPAQQNTYLQVTVSEQIKANYTANALVKLRVDNDDGKNNGIFICQRANGGTMTVEMIKNGQGTGTNTVLMQNGPVAPYDLQVGISGDLVTIQAMKDNKVVLDTTFDTSSVFPLSDPEVLAKTTYAIGARLQANESVTFTKAELYQLQGSEEILTQLDMTDLENATIYHDMAPYNTVTEVPGGIQFSANGTKGESFVKVCDLQQDMVLEATVTEQTSKNYTASSLLKFRDKTADNSKSNGIFLTQRSAAAGNKTFTLEVLVNGKSQKNVVIASDAVSCPYRLRLALSGSTVIASRVVNGVEQHITELDVSPWFDLSDPDVLKNFEATVGAKLDTGETMTYSSAVAKRYSKPENSEIPTQDKGIMLTVVKNGQNAKTKTFSYPAGFDGTGSYTLRAHWAGQYLSVWLVEDGKPYLLGCEDLGSFFDMRIAANYEAFQPYLEASLTPGKTVTVGEFRNYYTGGDGPG